jgi:signal transduction histidine kinase
MSKLSYKELEKELIALKKIHIEASKNQEYEIFFDNMAEMVEVIELIYNKNDQPIDFYIRDINLSFAKFLGKPKEQLINKKGSSVIGKIEADWLSSVASVDKTGKQISFKNYSTEFDKYYYVTSWRVSKNRVGISFTDISKNDNYEIEKQKFNETVLDNIPADIAVFDINHNYLYVNPKGIRNVETRKWMIGKSDFDYCDLKNIDKSLAQGRRDVFNKVIQNKEQTDWLDKYHRDGKDFYIMRKFYPVFIDDIFHYVIGYGVDVSELKEAQHELNQLNKTLKESLEREKELNQLKTKFVSTASHEFRTPLSAINFAAGYIKRYGDKITPSVIKKKLHKIEDQVLHMTQLLDDMLIVGQAEAGKMRNNPVSINLGNFIYDIIEEVESSSKESHEIELIDIENLKSGDIFIDEKLGRNIFVNLLSNALKFSQDAKKVVVELSSEEKYTVISITDFGIGIPKSEFKSIFIPFNRGKNVDLIQGTGLGLSIVKEAVKSIKGKIIIKSSLGNGTTFVVKIPKK